HRPHGNQLHQRMLCRNLALGHGSPMLHSALHFRFGHERTQLLVAGDRPYVQPHHAEPNHRSVLSKGENVGLRETSLRVKHKLGRWERHGDTYRRSKSTAESLLPSASTFSPEEEEFPRSCTLRIDC